MQMLVFPVVMAPMAWYPNTQLFWPVVILVPELQPKRVFPVPVVKALPLWLPTNVL